METNTSVAGKAGMIALALSLIAWISLIVTTFAVESIDTGAYIVIGGLVLSLASGVFAVIGLVKKQAHAAMSVVGLILALAFLGVAVFLNI